MILNEQTILISGGGGAIGSFICEYFYSKVSSIILIDKDESRLAEQKQKFPNLFTFTCDLTNPEDVKIVTKEICSKFKISVLINNAGLIHSEPLINMLNKENPHHAFDAWDLALKSNLYTTFYLTACISSSMVKNRTKGVIINISSIAAQGNIGQSAYAAAKAGVEALTKTWSKELGIFKIRCACIAPGFFNTSSTHNSLSASTLEKWQKSIPVGKLGEIEQIASACQFIIENDYFNGKVLALDGGLTI